MSLRACLESLKYVIMYAKTGDAYMSYPSDIPRKKFEIIREELETFSKRTSPRMYDLYDVFNALLYVLTTGCQWRALPKDYPKWQTVYRYYAKWSKPNDEGHSLLETVLKKLLDK